MEIENIERNRRLHLQGGDHATETKAHVTRSILDAASQIALPALAATSTICVVFFPVVLLTGLSRFLFSALALSVVLAMIASYVFSRTLVPAMANRLMPAEPLGHAGTGWWARANRACYRGFDRLRDGYTALLDAMLGNRAFTAIAAAIIAIALVGLVTTVGTDFFPRVDAGQMRLHLRAPLGTRIEDTERIVAAVERKIREVIPPDELDVIDDDIGACRPCTTSRSSSPTASAARTPTCLIALRPDHGPTIDYQRRLREILPHDFPGTVFYFQAVGRHRVRRCSTSGCPRRSTSRSRARKFETLLADRAQAAQRDPGDPRHRRRPHRAGARSPGAARRR